jgi:hypothetical protein
MLIGILVVSISEHRDAKVDDCRLEESLTTVSVYAVVVSLFSVSRASRTLKHSRACQNKACSQRPGKPNRGIVSEWRSSDIVDLVELQRAISDAFAIGGTI